MFSSYIGLVFLPYLLQAFLAFVATSCSTVKCMRLTDSRSTGVLEYWNTGVLERIDSYHPVSFKSILRDEG
jgi:hypothetical protein